MSGRIEKYTIELEDWDRQSRSLPEPGVFEVFYLKQHPYYVRFVCPCGCGQNCMLPVSPGHARAGNRPVWGYREGGNLIHPSVNFLSGCKSHFFIKEDGTVQWC